MKFELPLFVLMIVVVARMELVRFVVVKQRRAKRVVFDVAFRRYPLSFKTSAKGLNPGIHIHTGPDPWRGYVTEDAGE